MKEKAGFGEQAINKMAELAIASQLESAEGLTVQIKTDLNKLAKGEVDSIAIAIQGLLMPQSLIAEIFQLQIGRVTVKPLSAIRGKIELAHPSEGTLDVVINQDGFTNALNSTAFRQQFHQAWNAIQELGTIEIERITGHFLSDGKIRLYVEALTTETSEAKSIALVAVPYISDDGQVGFQNCQLEGDSKIEDASSELITALTAPMSDLLSLREFARKGTSLQIQQLDVTAGKLTLQAAAYIDQFPSS